MRLETFATSPSIRATGRMQILFKSGNLTSNGLVENKIIWCRYSVELYLISKRLVSKEYLAHVFCGFKGILTLSMQRYIREGLVDSAGYERLNTDELKILSEENTACQIYLPNIHFVCFLQTFFGKSSKKKYILRSA